MGNGNPLQYPCLGSSMDCGAWWATVHEIAELDATERWSVHAHTHTHTYSLFSLSLKPNSLHFFPRPGGTAECLNGHSNSGCFCLLAAGTSPVQVRETLRSEQKDWTPCPLLVFHLPGAPRPRCLRQSPCPSACMLTTQLQGLGRGLGRYWNQQEAGELGRGRCGRLRGSRGCRGSWERGVPGKQRATCPSVEEEPVSHLLGASAPGERHKLRRPEPAAD